MPHRFSLGLLILSSILFASCDENTSVTLEHELTAFEGATDIWHWFPREDLICRDGSSTGVSIRLGADKKKWVIYLMGGGACFAPSTCGDNPGSFTLADFEEKDQLGWYDGGILNTSRDENPVKDWNFIFVPYCTGDVHSGDNTDSYGLGLAEPQQFVGYRNIAHLLDWLEPYWESIDIDELMVTGISAGGFGTHLTYYEFKDRFPDVTTHVINDSGPLFGDRDLFPPCLQLGFQFIYNIPLPPGFILCCQPSYGLADVYTLAARLYPDDNLGLSSYWEDDVIRFFYAAGQNNCSGGEITGELYTQGLTHLRDNVLIPAGNMSTFFVEGDGHTFIQSNDRFFETEVNGKVYYEWVTDIMQGIVQHIE